MRARGTTNRNERGSSYDRARRKQWLLDHYGTGRTCPCSACGRRLSARTLTVDRIIPGVLGGRYTQGNIRPMCAECNSRLGSELRWQRQRERAA